MNAGRRIIAHTGGSMVRHGVFVLCLLSMVAFIAAGAPLQIASVQTPGVTVEKAGPYNTLVILNVTVIDGSGAPAYGPVNITVRNNIIDRIERVDAINAGRGGAPQVRADRVIDGRGMYVMPGR